MTVENFIRAESDLYFGAVASRRTASASSSTIANCRRSTTRPSSGMNRDTLYSAAVFDLDAGPVTITLPDAGKRFMSMQVINEDQYSPPAIYAPAKHTFTREEVGTRYMLVGVRTLVDPNDPADIEARSTRCRMRSRSSSKTPGKFEMPKWDPVSQKKVREALLVLATTLTDTSRAFGMKSEVDPIRHLVSAAATWGGNPRKDAIYLNFTPPKNDGKTIYKLNVKDVPVDGFWSISLYNADGYYQKNDLNAYSLNNITAKKNADGSVAIQFGGCDGKIPNCLPIMHGLELHGAALSSARRNPERRMEIPGGAAG